MLVREKKKHKSDEIAHVLDESGSVLVKICSMMNMNGTNLAHLRNATLDHFSKMKIDPLKSFILTRDPQY